MKEVVGCDDESSGDCVVVRGGVGFLFLIE